MTKRNAARAHHKATDPDRYLSVPHAARVLQVSRQTVYARIANPNDPLRGEHIAGRLVVVKASMPNAVLDVQP